MVQTDGTTVVSIAPYIPGWGDSESDNAAMPRISAAVQAVIGAYQEAGCLLDVGRWFMFEKDRHCPGNPAVRKAIRSGRPMPRA